MPVSRSEGIGDLLSKYLVLPGSLGGVVVFHLGQELQCVVLQDGTVSIGEKLEEF